MIGGISQIKLISLTMRPSGTLRTIKRHPERVNCHPIRLIARGFRRDQQGAKEALFDHAPYVTLGAMGGSKSKRPRPSYEDGKLRDPSIEKMRDKTYRREDLARLIKKAAKRKAPEGA